MKEICVAQWHKAQQCANKNRTFDYYTLQFYRYHFLIFSFDDSRTWSHVVLGKHSQYISIKQGCNIMIEYMHMLCILRLCNGWKEVNFEMKQQHLETMMTIQGCHLTQYCMGPSKCCPWDKAHHCGDQDEMLNKINPFDD